MSGAQVSSVPNVLFDPLMARRQTALDTANQNALLQGQAEQQKINANDIAMVGQAAAPLLGMSEEDAARAYPGIISELQARGGAKYAPATYPGHAATAALVQRAMPLMQQFETGFLTSPGSSAAIDKLNQIYTGGGTPPASTGTGGSAAPPSGAGTSDNNFGNIRPVGAAGGFNTYTTPQDGIAAMSHQLALYASGSPATGGKPITTLNGLTSTWAPKGDGANNPVAYAKALAARLGIDPDAEINLADPLLQTRLIPAMAAIEKGRPFNQPADVLTAGIQAGLSGKGGGPGTTVVAAAPGRGVAVRTGGTDVAGPGAGPSGGPPAPPAAPAAQPPPAPAVATSPAATTDLVGPRPLPPIGPNAPVVTPQSLANTPVPVPQPPPNQVMPGAVNGPAAQPPAAQAPPAPTPPAQGAPPAPAQQPPPAPAVATGMQSQQVQQAQELLRRATQIEMVAAQNPYDKRLQATAAAQAADLKQRAQLLMQTDSVVKGPGGVQVHTLTGLESDPAKPLPVWQKQPDGTWIDVSGAGSKPEVPPAPRFTEGQAIPDGKGGWRQVGPGEQGTPGKWGVGPGGTQFFPTSGIPAQANYDIAVKDLDKDRGEIAAIGDAGRGAQSDNLRVQEMRDILGHADTGPGTETAAHLRAWISRWTPGELSKWDGSGANLSNSAAIEMFQKLGFVGAVTQERGSTPRGGYQATKLFQQFNPGAQLLTSTNQGLLAQRLIANQAEVDYAQAAQNHYNTQHGRLLSSERAYDPLATFDAQWQSQRNPQVYAGAIGALGGQDASIWADGLSKEEIQRVRDVVKRADPRAVINMPGDAPAGKNRPPLTSFQR